MKLKLFIPAVLLAMSSVASAANYSVSASWTDPTPAGPGYTASYGAEHRVNGGVAAPLNDLSTSNFTVTLAADAGDTIEVRVRAVNTQGPTSGPWTTWFTATAPVTPVMPAAQTGVVITVTPQ